MASKEYFQILEQLKNRPVSTNPSIEKIREGFEKLLSAFPPEPDVQFESLLIDSVSACWTFAPDASRAKIILFFHGGGFNAGSLNSHRDLMGRISRASGRAVFGVNYRLAPEHPFPAALEDIFKTYQWLLSHSYSSSDIVFIGSSAGGGLALSLCLKLKEEHQPQPSAVVCVCPMVDLTFHSHSIETNKASDWIRLERLASSAKDYAQGQDLTNPLISPLFGDFHGFPSLFIQVGEKEILRDEAVAFAEKAKEEGVSVILEEWPEMTHCWHLFASRVPEGQRAINQIGKFIKKLHTY